MQGSLWYCPSGLVKETLIGGSWVPFKLLGEISIWLTGRSVARQLHLFTGHLLSRRDRWLVCLDSNPGSAVGGIDSLRLVL